MKKITTKRSENKQVVPHLFSQTNHFEIFSEILCYYAIFLSCTNSKEVYVPRRYYYYLTFFEDLFSGFKVKSWVSMAGKPLWLVKETKQTNLLSKRNGLKQKEAIYEVDFRFNMTWLISKNILKHKQDDWIVL